MLDTSIELLEGLQNEAEIELETSLAQEARLESQIADLQVDLDWQRSETAVFVARRESITEALAILEAAQPEPFLMKRDEEKFRDNSGELASWEVALLSLFEIGQKVVVNERYPGKHLHGRVVTVSKVVRNPKMTDGFEFYAETEEGHNIWFNFLNALDN